jgi:methylated-DNA-[protein]-cysteine S-methyltransferase
MHDATKIHYTHTASPIGELLLVGDGRGLHALRMQEGRRPGSIEPDWVESEEPFAEALVQLAEYFEGRRTEFELPLAPAGTPFQLRVWTVLREIPYGRTASYGEIARKVGVPSAPRAIGVANGLNPIGIIVPCHRVIGSDGSLTGYGGGLERKRWLLDLEAGALPLQAA